MLKNDLISLGLSEMEANVYLSCVELGSATVLEIARKTKVHRTTVYNTVQGLVDKKLFSESVRGKKRIFVAEGAEGFKNMLKAKLSRVDGIAGELIALSRSSTAKPIVKFYVGVESIKDMFRTSVLETKEKFQYGIFTVEEMMSSDSLKQFFLGEYSTLREKNGLFGKIIVSDTPDGIKYKSLDKAKFRETKMLPATTYRFPTETMISGDTVLLFVISENEQFVISIDSLAIATTFKMIFNALWTQGY